MSNLPVQGSPPGVAKQPHPLGPTNTGSAGSSAASSLGRRLRRRWESVCRRGLVIFGADPDAPSSGDAGRWPTSRQVFLWDLVPGEVAPAKDGVVAPKPTPQPWVAKAAAADRELLERLIAAEAARHARAHEAAGVTEGKASRLLTPCITLLAGAVALVALQLKRASTAATAGHVTLDALIALPGIVGIIFLFSGIVQALDADTRVGVYGGIGGAQLLAADDYERLRLEHKSANLATWTSTRKATSLMKARAATSRAVVFVALGLLLTAGQLVGTGYWHTSHQHRSTPPAARPLATPTTSPPDHTAVPSPAASSSNTGRPTTRK